MKFKKLVENKEVKNQKDLVDKMDLEVKNADEAAIEEHDDNVKNFKDTLKQCSLVEGYNYTNNENNYTVNLKNRSELAKLLESLKQNNIKHRISRSKTEGYRYDVTFKYNLKEDVEKTEVKKITTPRGTFEVVDKTEDELRKDGYGYHHSGNGYKIFVKNNQAVAIKEDVEKTDNKKYYIKLNNSLPKTNAESLAKEFNLEVEVSSHKTAKGKFVYVNIFKGTKENIYNLLCDMFGADYVYQHSMVDRIKELKEDINKGNNTPITDEDQKKEWEAEDENNWNESKKLKEMFEPISSFKEYTFIDKTNQGWEIKKAFRDLDDDRLHVIAYRPKRNDYAVGLGYSPDGGYWNQGWYDYKNIEDAISDLENEYNVEPFDLESAKLKKNESLKEDYYDNEIELVRDGEQDDEYVIIEGTRDGYGIDQVEKNCITVGELISILGDYPDNAKVIIGNDWQRGYFYTYGEVNGDTIKRVTIVDDKEEDDLEEESLNESKLATLRKASKQRKLNENEVKELVKLSNTKNLKEGY